MTEMMKLALERHNQIKKTISERESDIEKLKEEAEKLDLFVALAKELFANTPAQMQTAPSQPEAAPIAQPQRPEAPRVMPVRQHQSA